MSLHYKRVLPGVFISLALCILLLENNSKESVKRLSMRLVSSIDYSSGNDTDNNEKDELFCAVMNVVTGTYIDLSELTSTPNRQRKAEKNKKGESNESSKTRWLVRGWNENRNFTMSICSSAISKNEKEETSDLTNKTGAYYRDNATDALVSIGEFSTKPVLFGETSRKLVLKYGNGSICPNGIDKRSTLLNFVCDKEVASKAQISYIGNLHDCSYFFEVRSIHACPTSNDKNEVNVLGIFIGIFVVFFFVEMIRRRLLRNTVSYDRSENNGDSYRNNAGSTSIMHPRWEFIENEPRWRTGFRQIGIVATNLSAKIISSLSHIGQRYHATQASRAPIRLRSSPSSSSLENANNTSANHHESNNQRRFMPDMEAQNEILDSLDVGQQISSSSSNEDNHTQNSVYTPTL